MKHVFFLIFFFSIVLFFSGCDKTYRQKVIPNETEPQNIKDDEPLIEVENFGTFPGGEEEYRKFIDRNLNKAIVGDSALQSKRATFRFCIDTLGRIYNIKVLKSYNKAIDNECIRVLSLMPNWTPSYFLRNNKWEKDITTYVMSFNIPWKSPKFY